MSFRVNTNVAAMNALRNVGATSMDFSKSITRLSTGLRINTAADDPAGLIISESFRAQMAGMDQAVRNLVTWNLLPPAAAIKLATVVPAQMLSRPDLGRLAVGAAADLALFDDRLRVTRTFVAGRQVFPR